MESAASRTLVVILVATLFISLFGAVVTLERFGGFKALTGGATSTTYGSTNLTISSSTEINFTTSNVTFGSGYVSGEATACIMDSIGTASSGCVDFVSPLNANLTLENIGNTNVRLNLSNTNYTSSFIGGTDPGYAFTWDELESDTDTCTNTSTSGTHQAVTDFGGENTWRNITQNMLNSTAQWCQLFNASNLADTLSISFRILIPENAPARTLGDTFTATAVAI